MKKAAVKIIVVVAMAAAMFVNAVIPVSANQDYNTYEYIAKDYYGFIYLSNSPLTFYPFDTTSARKDANHLGITNLTSEPIIILVPRTLNNNIVYDIVISNTGTGVLSVTLSYNPITYSYETLNVEPQYLYGYSGNVGTADIFSMFAIKLSVFGRFDDIEPYYTILSNHEINVYRYQNYPTFTVNTNNITVDNTLSLDELIGNANITTEDIENSIINALQSTTTTIINNQSTVISLLQQTNGYLTTVNNNLNQIENKQDITNQNLQFIQTEINNIYNSGQGNKIPNNGTELNTAQQKLHQSEQALTNKSESLASRASSGINTAKTASTQFVTTITPAVSAVTGTVTQAIESLPQDIQPMIYSMPLLSFAVWLIGLKR